ncbi:MAG: Zn-ribbon domain-containing OB-fold protein [Solirubrobacteraceae bacterium]
MTTDQHVEEPSTIAASWRFDYEYVVGASATRFFRELRAGRIVGTHCEGCDRVLVPARSFCDACFRPTSEWREIGTQGALEAFTVLVTPFPGLPEPPLAIGYVTLDGADTAILNHVEGLDLSDVDAAAARLAARPRVEAVFRDEPEGRITDFRFRILDA